jgi:hypothetical protein
MNTRNGMCDELGKQWFYSALNFWSTEGAKTRALGGHSSLGPCLGYGRSVCPIESVKGWVFRC